MNIAHNKLESHFFLESNGVRILTLGLLLPMLAACGGGATLSTPAQPAIPNGTLSGESMLGTLQQPQYVSSPADLLYVANNGNNSITVFRHDVSGNASPLKVISGSNTGIDSPGQLAEDAQGNLYVANSVYDNASILVFAHGANGNVSPIRKIAGPLTGLQYIEAMTVDQQTGKIFVIDDPMVTSQPGYASLVRFPQNANGNEAPFARSPQNLGSSSEIANDSTGNNIIQTADSSMSYFDIPNVGLRTSAKQFANNAMPTSPYYVSVFLSAGVTDDPLTKTYLATGTPVGGNIAGIYRFAEDANGSFPYRGYPSTVKPKVVSIITSDTCGGQLALGYLRNIYVTHGTPGCPSDAVYVYQHDSSGNVSPLRILTGPATKLNHPSGIYEGQ